MQGNRKNMYKTTKMFIEEQIECAENTQLK